MTDHDDVLGQLLISLGVDRDTTSTALYGESNEVVLFGDRVLRLARTPGCNSLSREVRLSTIIPAQTGYPRILDYGKTQGYEWMLSERVPGIPLSDAWGSLSGGERAAAIGDIWARLQVLHDVEIQKVVRLDLQPSPFYAPSNAAAHRQLHRVVEFLDRETVERVSEIVRDGFSAMDAVPAELAHTDVGPRNVMWTGEEAIPIDYEFSSICGQGADLEALVSLHAPENTLIPLTNILRSEVMKDGFAARVRCFALLRDLWAFSKWLDFSPDINVHTVVRTWGPWNDLHRHLRKDSWLWSLGR